MNVEQAEAEVPARDATPTSTGDGMDKLDAADHSSSESDSLFDELTRPFYFDVQGDADGDEQ